MHNKRLSLDYTYKRLKQQVSQMYDIINTEYLCFSREFGQKAQNFGTFHLPILYLLLALKHSKSSTAFTKRKDMPAQIVSKFHCFLHYFLFHLISLFLLALLTFLPF